MKSDKYSNPIFEESDLFELIYTGTDLSLLDSAIQVGDLDEFINHSQLNFISNINQELSIEEFDSINQSKWYMPDEYKQLDIEEYLWQKCKNLFEQERVLLELEEYKKRNMLDLLKWLKYLVDTMRSNNIVWGVGRGSSVSSYVLYLLGVHKIDSLQYNLDFKEFMR
jgi:DNA polymerase III alpha subunit